MNKQEFLTELKKKLKGLAPDEIAGSIEYYGEMIDDAMEDGMSEEEAVESLGDIDDIVSQIRGQERTSSSPHKPEPSVSYEPTENVMPDDNNKKGTNVVLIIILIIVGIPLGIGVISTVFGIYTGMWGTLVGLYASAVGIGISGAALIISCPFIQSGLPEILVQFGVGFILLGLSIPFFMLCNLIAKGLVELAKLIISLIQKLIKGVKKYENII